VSTTAHFKTIAARGDYVAALTEDGTLYEWGYVRNVSVPTPTASSVSTKFASISLSGTHVLARSTDGGIYSWIAHTASCPLEWPVLGVPKAGGAHPCTPTEIATPVPFASIAAGDYTSFGIASDGVAYSWGMRQNDASATNEPFGMFPHGRGDDAVPTATPTPLATTERFSLIVAGVDQVAALRADGIPFHWGKSVAYKPPATNLSVPTQMSDVHLVSLFTAKFHHPLGDTYPWVAFEPDGHPVSWSESQIYFDQVALFLEDEEAQANLTLPRGDTRDIAMQPYSEARSLGGNGMAFPPGELSPPLKIKDQEVSPNGKVDANGVTFELAPPTIAPGQAATVLKIGVSGAAALGKRTAYVDNAGVTVDVVPPKPPEGTPLNLRCDVPESIVDGYWCLTNSGGATAPHKWEGLAVAGQTWNYENLCISYKKDGYGTARFKDPDNSVSTKSIRYGVLSRSSGTPEVTDTGDWLLYHEGIGDPQVEQVTLDPTTGAVGKAWPFTKDCPF
jgi:hypothetical protein